MNPLGGSPGLIVSDLMSEAPVTDHDLMLSFLDMQNWGLAQRKSKAWSVIGLGDAPFENTKPTMFDHHSFFWSVDPLHNIQIIYCLARDRHPLNNDYDK